MHRHAHVCHGNSQFWVRLPGFHPRTMPNTQEPGQPKTRNEFSTREIGWVSWVLVSAGVKWGLLGVNRIDQELSISVGDRLAGPSHCLLTPSIPQLGSPHGLPLHLEGVSARRAHGARKARRTASDILVAAQKTGCTRPSPQEPR